MEQKTYVVPQEKCDECRFLDECQYKNNEGADLSFYIYNGDGGCTKFRPKREIFFPPNKTDNDFASINNGFLYEIED